MLQVPALLLLAPLGALLAFHTPCSFRHTESQAAAAWRGSQGSVFHARSLLASPPLTAFQEASSLGADGGVATPDDPGQLKNFEKMIVGDDFKDVEPLLRTYLAGHPGSWKAYYFLAFVLLREHRVGDSIRAAAKSLELNVNNAEAHKLLGRDLTIVGRYDFAIREFQETLRLDPGSAEARYNLGRVYAIQDDFPRSRKELEAAIQLEPDYMEAHNALGFTLEALGDDAAAVENYQTAVKLNKERKGNFEAPFVNLSGYYNRRDELDLALDYAHKALELNPNSDLAYFQIAKACRTSGDWQGVVDALEKAVAIRPGSSRYYYILSTAYRKLGRIEESEKALATFRQLEKRTADIEERMREARRATYGMEFRPE